MKIKLAKNLHRIAFREYVSKSSLSPSQQKKAMDEFRSAFNDLIVAGRKLERVLEVVRCEGVPYGGLLADIYSVAAKASQLAGSSMLSDDILNRKTESLGLTARSMNCLKSKNIRYVGELVQWTDLELLGIPNMGRKSLNEIKGTLAVYGLTLGMKTGWKTPESS